MGLMQESEFPGDDGTVVNVTGVKLLRFDLVWVEESFLNKQFGTNQVGISSEGGEALVGGVSKTGGAKRKDLPVSQTSGLHPIEHVDSSWSYISDSVGPGEGSRMEKDAGAATVEEGHDSFHGKIRWDINRCQSVEKVRSTGKQRGKGKCWWLRGGVMSGAIVLASKKEELVTMVGSSSEFFQGRFEVEVFSLGGFDAGSQGLKSGLAKEPFPLVGGEDKKMGRESVGVIGDFWDRGSAEAVAFEAIGVGFGVVDFRKVSARFGIDGEGEIDEDEALGFEDAVKFPE
jgi:hypothetical protein